ncbi:MAG: hypothetical protein IPM13_19580 [Phycisphaerales bacterium]|nr:hypothetical protein [Phycisphaerales bacterium]
MGEQGRRNQRAADATQEVAPGTRLYLQAAYSICCAIHETVDKLADAVASPARTEAHKLERWPRACEAILRLTKLQVALGRPDLTPFASAPFTPPRTCFGIFQTSWHGAVANVTNSVLCGVMDAFRPALSLEARGLDAALEEMASWTGHDAARGLDLLHESYTARNGWRPMEIEDWNSARAMMQKELMSVCAQMSVDEPAEHVATRDPASARERILLMVYRHPGLYRTHAQIADAVGNGCASETVGRPAHQGGAKDDIEKRGVAYFLRQHAVEELRSKRLIQD